MGTMAQVEPMDIDNIDGDFDNKENSLHHGNVLPSCTEKGYEELDLSELNMKLRYSITPASSPMSKSLTTNCLDNRTFDCENYISNVVVTGNGNLTRSLNSTMAKNDMVRSLKSLPLQVVSTEDRNTSTLHILESKLDADRNTVTLNEVIDNDEEVSLPSTSSSLIHTPEATTPTKEIPKHDGSSPIMRGLKSVLNMFRSSQSPIQPSDNTPNSAIKPVNLSYVDPLLNDIQRDKCQVVKVSTPIPNKRREGSGSRRSSPLKESIVFNDDLEKELRWKDETTIFFKDEKIPIHKLFPQQSLSCISKTTEDFSTAELEQIQNNTEECIDVTSNIPVLQSTNTMIAQVALLSNDVTAAESDGEFVDCETTINDEVCGIKSIEKDNKFLDKIESVHCSELIQDNTNQALLENIQIPTHVSSATLYKCEEIKDSHEQCEKTDIHTGLNETILVNWNEKNAISYIGCDQQASQTENVISNIIQSVNDVPLLHNTNNKESGDIRMNNVLCNAKNFDESNLKVKDSSEHITFTTTIMMENMLKKNETDESTLSTESSLPDNNDVVKSETFGSLDVSEPIKKDLDEVKMACNIKQDLNLTFAKNEEIIVQVDDQQISNHSNVLKPNIEDCTSISNDIKLNLQSAELIKQGKDVENQVIDELGNNTEQAHLELNKDKIYSTIKKSERSSDEDNKLSFEIGIQIKAEKILRDSHLNLTNKDLKPEDQDTVVTSTECEELGNLTFDHFNILECLHENENTNISLSQEIPKETLKASEIPFNDEVKPNTCDFLLNKEFSKEYEMMKMPLENNLETETFNDSVCTNSAQNIHSSCDDVKNVYQFNIELCENISKTPLFPPAVDDLPDISSKLEIDIALDPICKDKLTFIKSTDGSIIDSQNSIDVQNQKEFQLIHKTNCQKFVEDLKSDNKSPNIKKQEVINYSNSVHEINNTKSIAQNGSMCEVGCASEISDLKKIVKTVHEEKKLDIIKIDTDKLSSLKIAKKKETVEKYGERVVATNINDVVTSEDNYNANETFNMSIDYEKEFDYDGNEISDLKYITRADSVDDKASNMKSNSVQFDDSFKTLTVPDILDSVKNNKASVSSENCLNNINLDVNTSKDLERVDFIENVADICTLQQIETDKCNILVNDTVSEVFENASNHTSQVTEIAQTLKKVNKVNGKSHSNVNNTDIKSEKIISDVEKPCALDNNIAALPPLSPKISSKGYNFNFDDIDDPFATKSNTRISPPLEGKPHSFTSVEESILSNNQSVNPNKDPILIQEAVTQDNSNVLNVPTDVRFDLLDKNTLVETAEVFVSQIEKNPIQTVKKSDNEIIEQEESNNLDVDTPTKEYDVSINNQNTHSNEYDKPKNVFNLPEMSGMFVSKSKICQSPFPALEAQEFSEGDFKNSSSNSTYFANQSQNCDGKNTENIDCKVHVEKVEYDSSDVSTSSKATDVTVHEVNTEDEDTVEGPFFETEDFNDADKKSDHDDMIDFSDVPAQVINDNADSGEIFIDAEAFQFLLNQNKSNFVADSGRESLFLKFDPLFAERMSTDGGLAAFGKVQKRQSTPIRISKAPPYTYGEFDKDSTDFPNLNVTADITTTLETDFEDPNVTVAKPMMVVNPAVNSIFSPRKKSTPPRTNRRSLTFTSPAIAVIDRLLSLSANNTTLNHDSTITDVRVETNETDLVLTQLRELLAEKEIHVHSLRLESKDLKERLCVLESQVNNLESESGQRLRKVNELNERLAEKTKINKSMAVVVEEYERTIASLTAEIEQDKKSHADERRRLISERNEQSAHLASMELAFNDLHSKYEKNKQIILSCKANEDAYRRSIAEFESSLLKMQNNYELLKQHATSKLNQTNQEFERLNRTHEAEILKLNAMIKRREMDVSSLKETLAQKTKANEELTAICDELLNKVG